MKEGNGNTGAKNETDSTQEDTFYRTTSDNVSHEQETIGTETDAAMVPDEPGVAMPSSSLSRRERKKAERERLAEEDRRKKEERRSLYPNWGDLLAVLGFFIVAALLAGFVSAGISKIGGMDTTAVNAIAYFIQMAATILFVVLQRRSRNAPTLSLRVSFKKLNLPLLLWGILLISVMGVVIEPILNLMPSKYLDILDNSIGTGGWAILTTVVMAPILEEVLFRGYIMGAMKQKFKPWTAILISAAIFGVIHILPQQAVNAFFCGVVLGYVYMKTGSLITVILIHMANNAVAYIQMELVGSSTMSTRELLGSDPLYFIIYGVCAALMIVGAVGMVRSLRAKNPKQEAETL